MRSKKDWDTIYRDQAASGLSIAKYCKKKCFILIIINFYHVFSCIEQNNINIIKCKGGCGCYVCVLEDLEDKFNSGDGKLRFVRCLN